jgi:glycerophosphoryl diester phosphodiesterase
MKKIPVFAHRGCSQRAPENTMAAFRLAVQAGCAGIETDAHLTADGKIALIHDENTRRTTDRAGRVAAMTMEELQSLDAGAWFDDAFAGERIPELKELLELMRPTGMLLNLELKNNVNRYPGLELAVLEEMRRFGMLGRAVFSSFNHASMALVKELESRAETALLYGNILYRTRDYAKMCTADGIHPIYTSVDGALVAECHAAGLKVRPWTVDDPKEAARLAALGVDALISNCPDELFAQKEDSP